MKIKELITDENLKSQLDYGTTDFPFECFLDNGNRIKDGRLDWHWHEELEFASVISGAVVCSIGPDTITLEAGDILFLNKNAIHRYEFNPDCQMKVITFSPDFIAPHESVIYQKSMAPFIVSDLKFIKADCGTEENARLGENIDELYEFAQLSELAQDANNMFRELKIHMMSCELWCTFLKIFAEDLSMCITKSHQTLHIRLQSMLNYIHKNYDKELKLDDLADSANISRSEALRCFKNGLHTTPVKYLNEYRMNRAKSLLQSTDEAITSIAMITGFESVGYFCKVFKKQFNLTPNVYRKTTRHK